MKKTLILCCLILGIACETEKENVQKNLRNAIKIKKESQQKHFESLRSDETRANEHKNQQLILGKRKMNFNIERKGDANENGFPLYIALHGGGGTFPKINDGQYEHMKSYYLANVKNGIYVATRAITDTYNLHSVADSFPFYDRLIENMIVFENVDPNRIYVLGFSAGGDGTYQIATRMADRFAAANMSAGHPNGINATNLYNLPFLAQVGEFDTAYNRHLETPKFYQQLLNLRKKYSGGYISECFIHINRGHNFFDNQPRELPQKIMANPIKWLEEKNRDEKAQNTSAISWLDNHERKFFPQKIVWDLTTRAESRGTKNDYFYYLKSTPKTVGNLIIVNFDKKENQFNFEKLEGQITLLLSSEMVDFSRPIRVKLPNGNIKIKTISFANYKEFSKYFFKESMNLPFETELTISAQKNSL